MGKMFGGEPAPEMNWGADFGVDKLPWDENTKLGIPPERKGMFGVKGTLRDILGVLGDSLAVGGGGTPIYHNQRQQEKAGDAFSGFADNPMAAIERLGGVNTELATNVWDKYQTNEARRIQAESMQEYRKAQAEAARDRNSMNARRYIGGTLRNIAETADKDPVAAKKMYDIVRPRVLKYRDEYNITDLDLPEAFDPMVVKSYSSYDMTGAQQDTATYRDESLQRRDRGLDIQETNSGYNGQRVEIARDNAGTSARRADESARHNRVTEEQGEKRLNQKGGKGSKLLEALGGGKSKFQPGQPVWDKNGDKWFVGEDGKAYRPKKQ